MTIYDFMEEVDKVAREGRFHGGAWLTLMCHCAALEEFEGHWKLETGEERNLFSLLLQRVQKAIDLTEEELGGQLEDLQRLLELQDRYIYGSPDFISCQRAYYKKAVAEAVRIQSLADRQTIDGLEQKVQKLQNIISGQDTIIEQLRACLKGGKGPCEGAPAGDWTPKPETGREKEPEIHSPVEEEKKPTGSGPKVPLTAELLRSAPVFLDGDNRVFTRDSQKISLSRLTDSQCAGVKELTVTEGTGPWIMLGKRLDRFPNLRTLTLGEKICRVERNALKKCIQLQQIIFENPDCVIEEMAGAFRGVKLVGAPGGQVAVYARQHGLMFRTQL